MLHELINNFRFLKKIVFIINWIIINFIHFHISFIRKYQHEKSRKKNLIHKRAENIVPFSQNFHCAVPWKRKLFRNESVENGLKDNVSCTIRFINRIPTKYHADISNTLATISNRVHRITGTYLLFTVYTVIHE